MSLTKQDLAAIKQLLDRSEDRLIARIDKLDETLSRETAAGLAEVHIKIDDLRQVVDRIERVQQAELERNDRQDTELKHMRKALHAA